GVLPSRIVIYGKSLGGAPACELAMRLPCAGVILQSTFTSIPDMAGEIIPLFPVGWFVGTDFDNATTVAKVAVPKLIVHSREDELVPYWMAERLHAAAAEPKRLVTFETGSHTGLVTGQGGKVLEVYREFIKGCVR
ncbi:MAG: alpha/beta hydrolase, partial [Planctomycetota bacterium]